MIPCDKIIDDCQCLDNPLPCRLTVVYRIVGQLMIMVVSGPWANTMSLVSLASAIARVAVMEVRAPDMPVDRVEKKLPEVRD